MKRDKILISKLYGRNHYNMKIIAVLLVMSCCCFGACSKQVELSPSELAIGKTVVTYDIAQEDMETKLKDYTVTKDEGYAATYRDSLSSYIVEKDDEELFMYITNEIGFVRAFRVKNEAVRTYKDIAVGDSIEKVKDAFEYEFESDVDVYSVLFNGNIEVDPEEDYKKNSRLWINYKYEDDIIISIRIYDVKYGRELQ